MSPDFQTRTAAKGFGSTLRGSPCYSSKILFLSLVDQQGQTEAVAGFGLFIDRGQVGLHGPFADAQIGGDFQVGPADGDLLGDLALHSSQAGQMVVAGPRFLLRR